MADRSDKSGPVRDDSAVFEVAIGYGAAPGAFKVDVISSPAGLASTIVRLDIELLQARRQELQSSVLTSSVSARRIVDEAERPVREVGEELFGALLGTGEVAGRYRASAALAAAGELTLRVVLRIDVPELAALPWEAMYDRVAGGYVGRHALLARHIPVAAPPAPVTVDPPLRILAVVSSPRGLTALDADTERGLLEEALSEPVEAGLVEVRWARSATWAGLQSQLMAGPWHVLHYIGHGDFDPDRDEGVLALTRSDGRADLVEASRFTDLLRVARPVPRVVVLNCCSSAANSSDLYSGTAAALVRAGVPAVAAMQYQVSDTASAEFARGFYTAVAFGRGVDEAVLSGRLAILGTSGRTLEWLTPVLYLRSDDARLFTVTSVPASAPARNQPTAAAAADRGDELRRGHEYGAAEEAYRDAIAADPDLARAYAGLGTALLRQGRYPEAESVLRDAIRLDPADSSPHCDLGEVLRELNREPEAEAEFEKALRLAPARPGWLRSWPHHHIGGLRCGQDLLDEAEACYREAVSLNPTEVWHHNELAKVLRQLGRYREAEAEFGEAIGVDRVNPWPHHDLAIMLSDLERFPEAESEFREAVRLHPDSPWPPYELGCLLRKLNRHAESEAALRVAVARDPGHPQPRVQLAHVLDQLGRHADAEAEYRQVIALNPAVAEAHDGLAHVLHATGRPDEAEAEHRQAIRLDPALADARQGLDASLRGQGTQSEGVQAGHVFISYVREDSGRVDRLKALLDQAGIRSWRDISELEPGQDWKAEIRAAIRAGSAFIACFSEHTERTDTSVMFAELADASEQMRHRAPGKPWLIPVRFAECQLPYIDLGFGRDLDALQRVDLFDGNWEPAIQRLVAAVRKMVGAKLR